MYENMSEAEAKILPFLFATFFAFIVLNLVLNFLLYSFTKVKTLKQNVIYWTLLLASFIMQGQFQNSELGILSSWCLNLPAMMILSKILYDSLRLKFPLTRFIITGFVGMLVSILLKSQDVTFIYAALPMTISFAAIGWEPALYTLRKHAETSPIQKFMAVIYVIGGIHAVNFALFRMVPDTQIIGFGATLALYQICSIGLVCLNFEDYSKSEKARLQDLVNARTEELSQTLQLKDTLFKLVLHDIANPVQAQQWILSKFKAGKELTREETQKILSLSSVIKEIIQQVRSMQAMKDGRLNLAVGPVNLNECLEDVRIMFEGKLAQKEIDLQIKNELPADTLILADKNTFTISVLSNLVSNAIKFSPPGRTLEIRAFLLDGKVQIEVVDFGIGMDQEIIARLFDPSKKISRPGTLGERGTGYGMPLVKSFVDHFGGDIVIESRPIEQYPEDHGTRISVSMEHILH